MEGRTHGDGGMPDMRGMIWRMRRNAGDTLRVTEGMKGSTRAARSRHRPAQAFSSAPHFCLSSAPPLISTQGALSCAATAPHVRAQILPKTQEGMQQRPALLRTFLLALRVASRAPRHSQSLSLGLPSYKKRVTMPIIATADGQAIHKIHC